MANSKIAVIITAAGSSSRMGSGIKKEYIPFKNGTVLSVCAQAFINACFSKYEITDFIITCPCGGEGIKQCKKALLPLQNLSQPQLSFPLEKIAIVEGGATRQASVYKALLAIKNKPEVVVIHDGARPFVSSSLIIHCIEAAFEHGASVPGLTPVDTQKEIDRDGFIIRHLIRDKLCAVQTPQCFDFKKLLKAHELAEKEAKASKKTDTPETSKCSTYTDDTEIWGKYCGKVKVVQGDVNNIKITYKEDLQKLEAWEQ